MNESNITELVQAASEAREAAYAPYSRFLVGCALLAGGRMYRGANIENASYGLAICAERSACVAAVMDGIRIIDAVAIVSSASPPAAPCGMCLQTLAEFCGDPRALYVVLQNLQGERRELTLAELLPHAFTKSQLTP